MAAPLISILFRNCNHDNNSTSFPDKVRYALQCDNFAVQIAKTPIQMPIAGNSPMLLDFGIFRPSLSISGIVDNKGGATDIGQKGFEFMRYFNYTRRRNNETNYTNRYYFPTKNRLEEDAYRWTTTDGGEIQLEVADANQPQLLKFADKSGKHNTDLNNPTVSGSDDLAADTLTMILDDLDIDSRVIVIGDYLVIEGENPASGDDDDLLWEIVKVTTINSGAKTFGIDRGALGSTPLIHEDGRNVYFYTEPTGGGYYEVAIQQARFQVDASKEDRWTFQMQFVCKARKDTGV